MSEQVQKLFDTIAPRYDLLNSLLSFRLDHRWRKQAVKKLQERRFEKVLDLCAGTLPLTEALLKKNPDCHVTAFDFSKPMLEIGRRKVASSWPGRVTCIEGDAMKIDFPTGSFDGVMSAYGMRNVDNNEIVLKRIFSVLRPGGRLVILEFFKPERLISRIFNLTYAEFVIPLLGKLVSQHSNAYHYLRDSVRRFYTPTAYGELLKSIGFTNIIIEAQSGGISHLITAEISPSP